MHAEFQYRRAAGGEREAKIRAEKINEEKGLKSETEAWERGKMEIKGDKRGGLERK